MEMAFTFWEEGCDWSISDMMWLTAPRHAKVRSQLFRVKNQIHIFHQTLRAGSVHTDTCQCIVLCRLTDDSLQSAFNVHSDSPICWIHCSDLIVDHLKEYENECMKNFCVFTTYYHSQSKKTDYVIVFRTYLILNKESWIQKPQKNRNLITSFRNV